ncbi:MAG: hypothetical protein JWL87_685 [Candidatus Adlerbacteria bacterium]|nr:hypothetical protein [Candidatus Adlerbacteria bacterium]
MARQSSAKIIPFPKKGVGRAQSASKPKKTVFPDRCLPPEEYGKELDVLRGRIHESKKTFKELSVLTGLCVGAISNISMGVTQRPYEYTIKLLKRALELRDATIPLTSKKVPGELSQKAMAALIEMYEAKVAKRPRRLQSRKKVGIRRISSKRR